MAKRGTQPPYTSTPDVAAFFERIANKAPPTKLDTDWVENYNIAANQPTGITAMVKWLGLLNEDGSAKAEIWNKIRQPSSRAEALGPVVREAYSAVFERVTVEEASRADLEGAFIDAYTVGDPKRKVGCFLALCEQAGIRTSAGVRSGGTAATTIRTKTPGPKVPAKPKKEAPRDTPRTPDAGSDESPAFAVALNVEVPAAWTEDEIRERIAVVSRAVREAKLDQA